MKLVVVGDEAEASSCKLKFERMNGRIRIELARAIIAQQTTRGDQFCEMARVISERRDGRTGSLASGLSAAGWLLLI